MKRGDLVTVAPPGDFGKPRPALVVQADRFGETGTAVLLLISTTLIEAPLIRIEVQPSGSNGLLRTSQIMVDKALSVPRTKVGEVIGHLEAETMTEVSRSLAVFLGIA